VVKIKTFWLYLKSLIGDLVFVELWLGHKVRFSVIVKLLCDYVLTGK
jgi:hypothetical protein